MPISVTSSVQNVPLIEKANAKFKRAVVFIAKGNWVGQGIVYTRIILYRKERTGLGWHGLERGFGNWGVKE
jgi:hypothetical protein